MARRKKASTATYLQPKTEKSRSGQSRDQLLKAAEVVAAKYGGSPADYANKAMWLQEGSHQWAKDRGYLTEPLDNEVFDTPKGVSEARKAINARKEGLGGKDSDRLSDLLDATRAEHAEKDAGGGGGVWGWVGDRLDNPAGNFVMEGLDKLDIARAGVVAGSKQLGNLAKGEGSWTEFQDDVDRRIGVGDILTENTLTDDLPINVRRALGFTGDVLLDPTTYLTMGTASAAKAGAGGAVRATAREGAEELAEGAARATAREAAEGAVEQTARRSSRRLLSSEDTINRVLDWGERTGRQADAERIVRNVDRVGGVAADEIADEIGIRTGVQFAGRTIPGTQGLARTSAELTAPVRQRARQTAARVFDREGMRALRLADPVTWAYTKRAVETGAVEGLRFGNGLSRALDQLQERWGAVDPDGLRRGLEGSAPLDAATRDAVADARVWLDSARDAANSAVARHSGDGQAAFLPRLDDYLPHQVSDEFLASLDDAGKRGRRAVKGTAPGIKRTHLKGKKFLGETLETGSVDEMHEIARRAFGDNYVQLFKTDPWAIMRSYADHLSGWVSRYATEGSLNRRGLMERLPDGVFDPNKFLRHQEKKANKLAERIEQAAVEAETADLASQVSLEEAARRGAVVPDTTEFERAVQMGEQGTALADDVGAEADRLALQQQYGQTPVPDTTATSPPVGSPEALAGIRDSIEGLDAAKAVRDAYNASTLEEIAETAAHPLVDDAVAQGNVALGRTAARGAADTPDAAKLTRRLNDSNKRAQVTAQQLNDVWYGGDIGDLHAHRDRLTAEIAGQADQSQAAAATVRQAEQAAGETAETLRARIGELQADVKRLDSQARRAARKGDDELAERLTDESAEAALEIKRVQRQIDQGVDTAVDTVTVDDAGRVVDSDPVRAAEARVEAARAAGDEKAVQSAKRALRRAKKGGDAESVALRAANNAELHEQLIDVEARIKLLEEYGSIDQIPRDVLIELNPKEARAFFTAQATLAKNQQAWAAAQLDAAVPPGHVPVIDAEGATSTVKLADGEAKKVRRAQQGRNRREVAKRVKATEDAVDVLDREQYVFDAATASRQNVRRLVDEADREMRELSERIDSLDGLQRQVAEDARDWWSRADQLAKQAEGELDEAAAEQLRLEAIGAAQQARAAGLRSDGERWAAKLGETREMEQRAYRIIKDGFTSLHDGRWADPDVARVLTRIDELSKPGEVPKLLRGYDRVLSQWKAMALFTPGYHIRNGMGAFFNNWLENVAPKSYSRTFRAFKQVGGEFTEEGIERIKDPDVREAFRWMIGDQHVTGLDVVARDMADVRSARTSSRGVLGGQSAEAGKGGRGVRGYVRELRGTSARRNLDPTALDNAAFRANQRGANAVARSFRAPLFLDRFLNAKAAGLSSEAAAAEARRAVIKVHFDYSDLAGWEQDVAKRIVPFYTWTRKNLPLQLEMMARQPGRYTVYNHAKRNLELGTQDDPFVPAYYSRLMGIRLPWQRNGQNVYYAPDLPFRDVGETLTGAGLLSSVTPALKTPVETWAGKQAFEGIPLSNEYVEVPETWAWTMPMMQFTPGVDPPVRGENGQWMMRGTDLYKMEQGLPLLGRLRRLFPSEKKYQDRAWTSWASTVFGQYTMTHTDDAARSEMWRQINELQADIDKYDQTHPGAEKE